MYVQKGIGTIPVVGWLPYEYAFGSSKTIQDYETRYLGTLLNTMCYTYVNLESHSTQRLTHVSNKINYYVVTIAQWTENGVAGGDEISKSGDLYASNYANSSIAVSNYMGTTRWDFAYGIEMSNYQDTVVDSINVFLPTLPGLVY